MADEATASSGPLHAVVSTDGDSDRPLVLGVDPATGRVQFFGGDLLGMVVAEYLQADAVVVPISCNDAIDRGKLAPVVEPKTRIGSPFVIAGMEAALAKGKQRVCGWEANGGFLTGSPITRNGATLAPASHQGCRFAHPGRAFLGGTECALAGRSLRPFAQAVQPCCPA
jgi:phosphomannomutase